MDKIYNIKYIDACYSYAKSIHKTKLSLHEAYGYIKRSGNNIVITFIKKKLLGGQEEMVLGLVIPDTALVSTKNTDNQNIPTNLRVGMSVVITWRDIVIFDSSNLRNDCSVMYTEGILFKIEKDHLIIKNPETIRACPTPIKNHPTKKPTYYIIPMAFVTTIKIVK